MLPPAAARKAVHASIVLAVSLSYLAYVFRILDARSWTTGLGDWQDPYFINALLEHWYWSVRTIADPSSPPMYFPVRRTLGYSHGLVLYAPFYVPLRLFLHPFHAYTLTLFVVMEAGILSLYVLLRTLRLSFIESLLLSAFFFSSQNVVHGETGVWSQRASVFLIPPVLLLLIVSARMRPGPATRLLAGFAGLLATLMYVQDFYTAHLALLFVATFGAAAGIVEFRASERIAAFWNAQSRASQVALAVVTLATAWVCYVSMFGGGELEFLGIRLRTHDWRRPALVALVALMVFLRLSGLTRPGRRFPQPNSWFFAVTVGAFTGAAVFLWIYSGAYREHGSFPDEYLLNSLAVWDPSRWTSPQAFMRDLGAYKTLRSFILVFVVGTLAWTPWFNIDRKTRSYCLWFLAISFVVLLIPFRFGEVSLWGAFFRKLPGFGAIRDPKRIIHIYELAVVLVVAGFLARLPAKSAARFSVTLLALVLLVAGRNREAFDYGRPLDVYDRWVAAPIDVDPGCASFYIKGASQEYMSRSSHGWTLYAIDSLFVSQRHRIPTLNGYSAWFPGGWDLHNPHEADYPGRVKRWIDTHRLTGVCEFDVHARTMKLRY